MPVDLPASGHEVSIGIRPEHIEIEPAGHSHTVELTEALGGVSYVHLRSASGAKLIAEERGEVRSIEGQKIGLKMPKERIMLFDKSSGARIR